MALEAAPITCWDCVNLELIRRITPNTYIRNEYMNTELTALGWAVFLGHSKPGEDVVKYCMSLPDVDVDLPMRSGYFEGKTAKDIATYYKRTNLLKLLTGETPIAAKHSDEDELTAQQRRASRYERRSGAPPEAIAPLRASHAESKPRTQPTSENSSFSNRRASRSSKALTSGVSKRTLTDILDEACIPQGDRDKVEQSLTRNGLTDMRKLMKAQKSDLLAAGLQSAHVLLLFKAVEKAKEEDKAAGNGGSSLPSLLKSAGSGLLRKTSWTSKAPTPSQPPPAAADTVKPADEAAARPPVDEEDVL